MSFFHGNATLTLSVFLFVLAGAACAEPLPGSHHEWREPVTDMTFVWIPPGCFWMGAPPWEPGRQDNEEPLHEVCLAGFWLSRFEATNRQYRMFRGDHASQGPKTRQDVSVEEDDRPVARVGLGDAMAFSRWLSGCGAGGFRLPTEAEWEYAARAGTRSARYWGDPAEEICDYSPWRVCDFANVYDVTAAQTRSGQAQFGCDDHHAATAPAGTFRPNAFGLHDMLGNVWEWVVNRPGATGDGPPSSPGAAAETHKGVARGGAWIGPPSDLRAARRQQLTFDGRFSMVGFRLVWEGPPPPLSTTEMALPGTETAREGCRLEAQRQLERPRAAWDPDRNWLVEALASWVVERRAADLLNWSEELVLSHPDQSFHLLMRGRFLTETRRFGEAIEILSRSAQLGEAAEHAQDGLCRSMIMEGWLLDERRQEVQGSCQPKFAEEGVAHYMSFDTAHRLLLTGEEAQAAPLYREALARIFSQETFGELMADFDHFAAQGWRPEAAQRMRDALQALWNGPAFVSRREAAILTQRVQTLRFQDRLKEAVAWGEQAVQIRRESLGADHLLTRHTLERLSDDYLELGKIHEEAGEHDQAAALFQRLIAIRKEIFGPDRWSLNMSRSDSEMLRKFLETRAGGGA